MIKLITVPELLEQVELSEDEKAEPITGANEHDIDANFNYDLLQLERCTMS